MIHASESQSGTSSLTAEFSNLQSHTTSCDWSNGPELLNQQYGRQTCEGTFGECEQTFDLLTTKASEVGRVPLAVYVHGGSWRAGKKSKGLEYQEFTALRQRGMHFASLNYRLTGGTPEVVFPTHAMDVSKAIAFFKSAAFADQYNVDPERVFLIGSSAGGHLVSMVGTTQGLLSPSRPAAVVNFYGPMLLNMTNDEDAITNMLNCTTPADVGTACNHKATRASPVTHVSSESPPFLSFYGIMDKTYVSAPYLQEAGEAAGADYTLNEVDCENDSACHDLTAMFESKTGDACNVDVMYDWLYKQLHWHPTGCGASPGVCPSATD